MNMPYVNCLLPPDRPTSPFSTLVDRVDSQSLYQRIPESFVSVWVPWEDIVKLCPPSPKCRL